MKNFDNESFLRKNVSPYLSENQVSLWTKQNSEESKQAIEILEQQRLEYVEFTVKKNEETASLLAWKCPKLRRLEHWEDGGSKVIVLLREDGKVKYQVRRIKPENRNNSSTQ